MKIIFALLVIASCSDPVHDAEVAALGAEDPSVPPSALHRPGQPCLTCHGTMGPASARFSFGGTVFTDDLTTPQNGATITIVDARANQTQAMTNAAGNFFVLASDFTPVFPIGSFTDDAGMTTIGVTIVATDPNNPAQMITQIGRDGSCATCHFGSGPSSTSPGPVYVTVVQP